MKYETLKLVLDKVLSNPDLMPTDAKTFCNEGVKEVFKLYLGYSPFNENEVANRMIDRMKNSHLFKSLTTEEAWEKANQGEIVVAAHRYPIHGHVAVVYPTDEMGHSNSWNKDVPYVANIGKTNGVMKVSEAFPVKEGEPNYYWYVG